MWSNIALVLIALFGIAGSSEIALKKGEQLHRSALIGIRSDEIGRGNYNLFLDVESELFSRPPKVRPMHIPIPDMVYQLESQRRLFRQQGKSHREIEKILAEKEGWQALGQQKNTATQLDQHLIPVGTTDASRARTTSRTPASFTSGQEGPRSSLSPGSGGSKGRGGGEAEVISFKKRGYQGSAILSAQQTSSLGHARQSRSPYRSKDYQEQKKSGNFKEELIGVGAPAPFGGGGVSTTATGGGSGDGTTPENTEATFDSSDDKSPPVISCTPESGSFATPPEVTCTINKPGDIYYCFNNSDVCNPKTSGIVYAGPFVLGSTNSTYYFSYYGVDTSGNETSVRNRVLTIDSDIITLNILADVSHLQTTQTTNITIESPNFSATATTDLKYWDISTTTSLDAYSCSAMKSTFNVATFGFTTTTILDANTLGPDEEVVSVDYALVPASLNLGVNYIAAIIEHEGTGQFSCPTLTFTIEDFFMNLHPTVPASLNYSLGAETTPNGGGHLIMGGFTTMGHFDSGVSGPGKTGIDHQLHGGINNIMY